MNTFNEFGLLPTLQATLEEKSFKVPTEIQSKSVPLLLKQKSIVGVAETGSGKTLAYALPILHTLKTLENEKNPVKEIARPRAIVIVPTRELGEQVSKVFKPFTHSTRLRVRVVLGGTTSEVAKRSISGAFEILVATPGRLVKFMDRKLIDLSDIRFLVFDEADQMLDQGFLPAAEQIVGACPEKCQLALFSATVNPTVELLMKKLFFNATVIRTQSSQRLVSSLKTMNKKILNGKRFPVLESLIAENVAGGTIVFTNTRAQCDTVATELSKKNVKFAIYRGEMDKVERRANLKKFRNGEIDLLVSTDLASRGLDIELVGRVINYHLPSNIENYIHRVGRTARAGRKGLVINFVTERDLDFVKKLDGIKSKG